MVHKYPEQIHNFNIIIMLWLVGIVNYDIKILFRICVYCVFNLLYTYYILSVMMSDLIKMVDFIGRYISTLVYMTLKKY